MKQKAFLLCWKEHKKLNAVSYPEKFSLCMVRMMASMASVRDSNNGCTAEDINSLMAGRAWSKKVLHYNTEDNS